MKRYVIAVAFILPVLAMSCTQPKEKEAAAPRKIKNIIFMVGDGMGTTQIYAGLTANKGSLNLERFKCIGFSRTNSADNYMTESAAGATAFSIGQKTYNGAIGVDTAGKPQPTIMEIAKQHGLSTGIVVTTDITDATPATFAAHQKVREMQAEIAADYVKSDVDVLIGAGQEHFDQRKDGRNLLTEFIQKGYQVKHTTADVAQVKQGKLVGLIKEARVAERGDQLARTTQAALQLLQQNKKGFFLVVEGSKIDDGGHANDLPYVTEEVIDFDKAIKAALDFADKDGETLVVVTADHETGGLTIAEGDLTTGKITGKFSTDDHTGVMVPVFAYGPGAEAFMGIYHNNTIFRKFMEALKF
ncbi:alkaline phosphatase [Chitinophaga nivalis]|uniref:Alkaline phosphatase n=1 Tax=Chitinophaga nivalis TaxID=2991709 RepID=A0ABT3IN13_9BACT|nr:alkaline phosphatase [Chitinophaga nivalis]MCW3464957.1 alkaline phosphatase [Chitinophaga nivalis]MCW3485351.1 alkaline phosphatase [Chitinophaga nivalis]